ncbi:MAG: patatin-like phospholipase family protein [Verrucomicrobia bacterium]|nr:patatin-like phospholipase family protein [Verrucomicrobiota bacterium]MCH8512679.1 patatin-like phospholipase family protein [Kiritimatiellia bacterium]
MNTQQIRSHPLLNLLPKSIFRHLLENAELETCEKGTFLFHESEACACCYLILSGRCETFVPLEGDGRDALKFHGPGESVGARDVFHHHPQYRKTARVITDCLLLRVDAKLIHALFERKPRLVPLFEQYLREKMREQQEVRRLSSSSLGRVVTLVSLDPGLPVEPTATTLAQNLASLVHAPILELCFTSDEHGVPLKNWEDLQPELGGEFCFNDQLDLRKDGDNRHVLHLRLQGAPGDVDAIAPLLSHAANHFRFVLLNFMAGDLPHEPLVQCLVQADTSYMMMRPDEASLNALQQLARSVRSGSGGDCVQLKPMVFSLPGERSPGIFREIQTRTGLQVHSYVQPESFLGGGNVEAHLRRLAREIARCRVGLALSTGGACGLAHIGVLQALEEAGIEIDLVVGASMGSYIAAMWGCGKSPAEMEAMAKKVEGRWGLLKLIDPVFPPRRGIVRGKRPRRLLESVIGDAGFSDLLHPIRIVATRISPIETMVFRDGRLSRVVQASSAMPGICVPVNIDGIEYTDAGISDPLPVDVLEAEGIETIIAVDTLLGPEAANFEFEGGDSPESVSDDKRRCRKKRPGFFSRHFNYFAPGNMLNVVLCGFRSCQIQVAEEACRQADIVLRVTGPDDTWYEFHNPAKYIEAGRRAAESHLEEIQSKIRRERHEPETTDNKMVTAA